MQDGRQELESLISQLGAALGLGEFGLDEEGGCAFSFDSIVLNFVIRAEDGSIVCYARLRTPAPGRQAELQRLMLEANLTGAETGGVALALDGASGDVVLVQRLPLSPPDYPAFECMVERLVDAAELWQARLGEIAEAPASPAGAEFGLRG